MGTRLFVGNLSYNVSEQELKEVFQSESIEVRGVRIAVDRDSGRPRGFAFVETETEAGARQSIEKLAGKLIQGRAIVIEEAQGKPGGGQGQRPAGGGQQRANLGPRAGGDAGGPRQAGPLPAGQGGRVFGSPKSGPGGFEGRQNERGSPRTEGRRERPEKKRSSRPKPEERERGNWHWSGILDDD